MARFVYDKDLECLVEVGEFSNRPPPEKRMKMKGVISDIEPYRAVASDIACGGKRPVIGGRRQHREFLRRNEYVEVGNDFVPNKYQPSSRSERIDDIRRAMGDFGSNVGGRYGG